MRIAPRATSINHVLTDLCSRSPPHDGFQHVEHRGSTPKICPATMPCARLHRDSIPLVYYSHNCSTATGPRRTTQSEACSERDRGARGKQQSVSQYFWTRSSVMPPAQAAASVPDLAQHCAPFARNSSSPPGVPARRRTAKCDTRRHGIPARGRAFQRQIEIGSTVLKPRNPCSL